jgi:hypothetical protein
MRFVRVLVVLVSLGALIALFDATPVAAADSTVRVVLAWSPGPGQDDDGLPVAPAVRYQVIASLGGGPGELLAEVAADTTCEVTLVPGGEYRVRVVGIDAAGRRSVPGPWSKAFVVPSPAPPRVGLHGNSPNPFNPLTRIRYGVSSDLAFGERPSLVIYDVRGHAVRHLPIDPTPGEHTVAWDGADDRGEFLPTGTYLARYVQGDRVATLKMMLTR